MSSLLHNIDFALDSLSNKSATVFQWLYGFDQELSRYGDKPLSEDSVGRADRLAFSDAKAMCGAVPTSSSGGQKHE